MALEPRPAMDVASRVRSERPLPVRRWPRAATLAVLAALLAVAVPLLVFGGFAAHPPSRRAAPTPPSSGRSVPTTTPSGASASTMPRTPSSASAGAPTTIPGPIEGVPAQPGATTPSSGPGPGQGPTTPSSVPIPGQPLVPQPIPGFETAPGAAVPGALAASSSASQVIKVVVPCVFPSTQHCPESTAVREAPSSPHTEFVLLLGAFALLGVAASVRRRATLR